MQMRFCRLLLLSLVIPLGLTACGGSGSSSGVNSKVNVDSSGQVKVPETASIVVIRVMDDSKNPVSGLSISVKRDENISFTDTDKDTNSYKTGPQGLAVIELKEGATSGKLVASVTDPNYFGATQIIQIDGGNQQETFVLTKKSGESVPSAGIVKASNLTMEANQSVDFGDGIEINNAQVAEVKAKDTTEPIAQVVLAQGVVAKTESGVEAVGALKIDAAVYKNSTSTAISAFPGGLIIGDNVSAGTGMTLPEITVSPEDPTIDASDRAGFITAGFVALEVTDQNGQKITKFEGRNGVGSEEGLVITTLVPKSTRAPNIDDSALDDLEDKEATAAAEKINVQIGDTVPIWSYNSTDGQWTYEGDANIYEEADAENWRARFSAKHLTYWNMDYFVRYCEPYIEFRGDQGLITRPLMVEFSRFGEGSYGSTVINDGYIQGMYWPRFRLLLNVTDITSGKTLSIRSINGNTTFYKPRRGFNFCSNRSSNVVFLDTSALQPITYTPVNIKVTTSCSNAALNTANGMPRNIPSSSVYVYRLSNNNYEYIDGKTTDTNGEVLYTNLASNGNYRLYVYDRINYTWITHDIVPNQIADPYSVEIKQTCPTVTTGTGGSSG